MDNLGMVTIDVVQFETMVRENERLRHENERLNGLLFSVEQRVIDSDNRYRELLDRIALTH